MHEYVRDSLSAFEKADTVPYSVHQGATLHLASLYESIRVQRNEAVHPAAAAVSRKKVYFAIQSLPSALEAVYRLMAWLQHNSL